MKQLLHNLNREQSDTLLLLLAALAALLPHTLHLPWWISLAIAVTLGWRAVLTYAGWRLPPIWLLLPVALAAMAGVHAQFHTWLGRDTGVAMLTLLLGFKMLEMRARRDVMVVIFLCYFVLLSNYFYSQSMLMALHSILALALMLSAQLSFQYGAYQPPLRQRLALVGRLLLYGAPLALLLFLGFPRISGPLWGLPGDAHTGSSGLSDSMAPGSISTLARSDALAFRVQFQGPHPSPSQLYWRTIVLGDYDGRSWTRVHPGRGLHRADLDIRVRNPALAYELTLEVQQQPYLPALELSGPQLELDNYRVVDTDEMEFVTTRTPGERLRYRSRAWLTYRLQAEASRATLQRWLELPDGYNPRTLALAAQLSADHAAAPMLVERLLQRLRTSGYRYTLEPALLGRHAVDEFLFDSKAGFCEHFAGAFVFTLRAMGVPARVVTGYQGGEFNPVDGVLSVRQADAHAWAEFWQAGVGWQRVDPTAAVAPQRIAGAADLATGQRSGTELLQTLSGEAASLLTSLRFQFAALNNQWNQWVLDYTPQRQQALLDSTLASSAQASNLWPYGAGALGVAMLLCGLAWLRRRRPRDPLTQLYAQFCRQQAHRGFARAPHEGPLAYAQRLRLRPTSAAQQAALQEFLMLYSRLRYGADSPESRTASLAMLRKLLVLCR
ncbi:DUF3488 and DUF4129 domain-containing transglutaminase family protein [Pseudoduganella danionis]|uniref:transglutaminase TgpA family protein n=1 Tax=Pseudoduganella danionis TaxID=1890295 RepID=UPI0035AF037F